MKELRLALIGCAGRGRIADLAHDPKNGVRLVAGADKYPDAIDRFLVRFGEQFEDERLRSIALHSRSLNIKHPMREERIFVEAPLPEPWKEYVSNYEF